MEKQFYLEPLKKNMDSTEWKKFCKRYSNNCSSVVCFIKDYYNNQLPKNISVIIQQELKQNT